MRLAVVLSFLFLIPAVSISQTTWYVPDDFPKIQDVISDVSVVDGDTVIVRPGTYVENIDFLGKAIKLKSELGATVTIIDGGNPTDPFSKSVVKFINGEDYSSVLDGFKLINGAGTYHEYTPGIWSFCGAGIYLSQSSPTITNNIITGNTAYGYGGGIFGYNSSPIVTNNTVSDNNAGWMGALQIFSAIAVFSLVVFL